MFDTEHSSSTLDDIITVNPAFIDIKKHIEADSSSDAPVLVYGKTGTGKELVCNAIHKCSSRADGPFIVQNCAAIPSTLLESLLFGNVKGSFTGAENSIGLFEMANKGTLFLDEINSKLVYASLTGYGRKGEKKERACFDNTAQAFSSMLDMTGYGGGAPITMGAQLGNLYGGMHLALGIVLAVINVRKGGDGQMVDVSASDSRFPHWRTAWWI
ncbi:MAG: sigma 54-interacting transcriptional regulator [Anaerovoracaceae bacterium]